MRLKTTIQKNMILIIAATLVIAYAMTTFVVYRQTVRVMEDEVRQEADYICTAIEISGPSYLEEMDAVRENQYSPYRQRRRIRQERIHRNFTPSGSRHCSWTWKRKNGNLSLSALS